MHLNESRQWLHNNQYCYNEYGRWFLEILLLCTLSINVVTVSTSTASNRPAIFCINVLYYYVAVYYRELKMTEVVSLCRKSF
jgi:hypothetical protein